MTTWEYMIFTAATYGSDLATVRAHEGLLNGLGAQGWEVVSATLVNPDATPGQQFTGCYRALLKRQTITSAPPETL